MAPQRFQSLSKL